MGWSNRRWIKFRRIARFCGAIGLLWIVVILGMAVKAAIPIDTPEPLRREEFVKKVDLELFLNKNIMKPCFRFGCPSDIELTAPGIKNLDNLIYFLENKTLSPSERYIIYIMKEVKPKEYGIFADKILKEVELGKLNQAYLENVIIMAYVGERKFFRYFYIKENKLALEKIKKYLVSEYRLKYNIDKFLSGDSCRGGYYYIEQFFNCDLPEFLYINLGLTM